jgi:uncharacterized Zn-binding protein involved in type VI secretion
MDTAAGPQIGANQTFVTVEGMLWMVRGDVNAPHGFFPHVPGGDNMAQGSSFVSIDGIPVCRQGHLAGCGHPTSGASWFKLSD